MSQRPAGNSKRRAWVQFIPHSFCRACKVWFNRAQHLESEEHVQAVARANAVSASSSKETEVATTEATRSIDSSGRSWEDQWASLVEALGLKSTASRDKVVFEELCSAMKSAIMSGPAEFHNLDIQLYGSSLLGLAKNNSDLDVSLSTPTWHELLDEHDRLLPEEIEHVMTSLVKTLTQDGQFTYPCPITRAKTPLLKIFFRQRQVDITIINSLAVNNSNFIKFLMDIPLFKQSIIVLREWCNTSKLALSKYAVMLLLIYHFETQSPPLLPPINQLINSDIVFKGWSCSFIKKDISAYMETRMPLKQLLQSFFKHMTILDFAVDVIDVRNGSLIENHKFISCSSLPSTQKQLVENMKKNSALSLQVNNPMCIQDPFDLSHNTTANISFKELSQFRQNCKISAAICESPKDHALKTLLKPNQSNDAVYDTDNNTIVISFSYCLPPVTGSSNVRKYWFQQVVASLKDMMKHILHMHLLEQEVRNDQLLIKFDVIVNHDLWKNRDQMNTEMFQSGNKFISLLVREQHMSDKMLKKLKPAQKVTKLSVTIAYLSPPTRATIEIKYVSGPITTIPELVKYLRSTVHKVLSSNLVKENAVHQLQHQRAAVAHVNENPHQPSTTSSSHAGGDMQSAISSKRSPAAASLESDKENSKPSKKKKKI